MAKHPHESTGSGKARAPQVVKLTPAEAEVVALLAQGLSNRELAAQLGKSEGTIKNQLSSVFRKLAVKNRLQLLVQLRP